MSLVRAQPGEQCEYSVLMLGDRRKQDGDTCSKGATDPCKIGVTGSIPVVSTWLRVFRPEYPQSEKVAPSHREELSRVGYVMAQRDKARVRVPRRNI